MYAKQYQITLPADYDMGIIRKRVADGGHVLDDRAGLGMKAYLIRERGVADSPVNQYAPFYLWNDSNAMAHFLFGGGGFQNIVRDFGRPTVQHWTGVSCHVGPARDAVPQTASRLLLPIPIDADPDRTGLGLAAWVEHMADQLHSLAQHEEVHTAVLAVDPHHWQAMQFVLWEREVAASADPTTERYAVLHLSVPELDAVPDSRVW
jgi:hypothetical protein